MIIDHVRLVFTPFFALFFFFYKNARLILLVTLPSYFSYEKGFTFNQYPFALLRVEEGKVLHAKGKGEGTMFPMTVQKTNQALGELILSLNMSSISLLPPLSHCHWNTGCGSWSSILGRLENRRLFGWYRLLERFFYYTSPI